MAKKDVKFPDDLLSNQEIKKYSFGETVAKAIENQWYDGNQLSSRRKWISKMRRYAKGEQLTDYKSMIEGKRKNDDSQIKTHKIDYSEKLKIYTVFRDILTNSIDESLFKPRAEAIDVTAINDKKNYFTKLDTAFYTKEFAEIISKGIGVDIRPKNVAKDERDLEVKKLEYKPEIEIAQELAIENVLKYEKFETIKDKVDEDLVDLGVGIIRHYTDKTEGIKLKYVDPHNYIHSSFEMDDGRDIRYHGVLENGTIGDLMKQSDGLTDDQLLAIKNYSLGNSDSTVPFNYDEDSDRLIEYISFSYLVSEKRIFKKRNKRKHIKFIDKTNEEVEYTKSNRLEIPYLVWYEGIYIPTAQVLIKWGKIKNQVESGINTPISPFLLYAPKVKRKSETGVIFDSSVQRAIPIIDDLQRDWYKFQQLKMELRPNTIQISPKALNNVKLNGVKISAKEVLEMFFGRGILLADEFDEEGDPIGRAITEQNGGINNSALIFLSNEFANNYNRLRQLLGINELRDGTTIPNSKTSVTVQKLLLASSNNATNHIVKASFNLSLRIAESISFRLYDVLSTKVLKDRYMNIIGSGNVELLDVIKELPMRKFGIYFDFRPDNKERFDFEQSLVNSYNQKEINVAQYNKARQIRNVKSAIKYLEYAITENRNIFENNKVKNIEKQAEANAKTSVIVEQTKQQTITVQFEIDKQLLTLEHSLKQEAEKNKALIEELMSEKAHKRKLEIAQIEANTSIQKEEIREDRKDNREDQRATNQSKLIDQRKNDKDPIDFSNDNNIDFSEELNKIFKNNTLQSSQAN